jgi:hypothetical protein
MFDKSPRWGERGNSVAPFIYVGFVALVIAALFAIDFLYRHFA